MCHLTIQNSYKSGDNCVKGVKQQTAKDMSSIKSKYYVFTKFVFKQIDFHKWMLSFRSEIYIRFCPDLVFIRRPD